jgi:glycosyltransferase involved in cell wall biosynthesis
MLALILLTLWKHKPDILHIQANGHRLFFWILLLKPFKTRVVNTIHDPVKHLGDELSRKIDDSLVIKIGRVFVKRYIVHGEYLKTLLRREYKISEKRIVSIPHGNFNIYKQFQIDQAVQDNNMVLFFGRIWAYKGLEYFIEAANIVCEINPRATFYIVGAGEAIKKYIARIKHKNKFVVVNRRVPLEEAGQYFQKAGMVVLPYLEATQSGVIPVAYSYARPVIASRVGSLPEVVLDGSTGFLVDPCSYEQIAEKILFLLDNYQIQNKMGRQAFDFANSELSWERIAELHYNVYTMID